MMLIEKVHGLNATSMSMNERFTMLSAASPMAMVGKRRPNNRPTIGSFLEQQLNIQNRFLIEQIARRLQQQTRRRELRLRLGHSQAPGLRRFGSEGNLPRANSYGNLRAKNRQQWRPNYNGNMNRSSSFGNLSQWGRGRRRGGARPRLRGNNFGGVNRGARRGRGRAGRGRGRTVGLAAARMARARALPSRGELDAQLDRYMSLAPAALDRQLDQYMHDAGDPIVETL